MASWGDDKINVFEEVKDAIASNLIRKNAAQDYIYGEEVLGSTEDQVISKLLQNENAGLRVAIKSKLMIR
jgi:formaldehyde-activating enzyme involved in methanogenesis